MCTKTVDSISEVNPRSVTHEAWLLTACSDNGDSLVSLVELSEMVIQRPDPILS
jgi:hypothetical protein